MSENPPGKSTSTLSIISFLSASAVVLGLTTGLFDRGTSSGAFNEKILNVERSVAKVERIVDDYRMNFEKFSADSHKDKIDIVKLQASIEQLKSEITNIDRNLADLRNKVYKDR